LAGKIALYTNESLQTNRPKAVFARSPIRFPVPFRCAKLKMHPDAHKIRSEPHPGAIEID